MWKLTQLTASENGSFSLPQHRWVWETRVQIDLEPPVKNFIILVYVPPAFDHYWEDGQILTKKSFGKERQKGSIT